MVVFTTVGVTAAPMPKVVIGIAVYWFQRNGYTQGIKGFELDHSCSFLG